MRERKQRIRGIIAISVVVLELVVYFLISRRIADIKADEARYFRTETEFMRTIDCAPLFDAYQGHLFELKFDICAEKAGKILVYQQNASSQRYTFREEVDVTEEFREVRLIVKPILIDEKEETSFLAFYGEYGSGVIPTVRDISIIPIE